MILNVLFVIIFLCFVLFLVFIFSQNNTKLVKDTREKKIIGVIARYNEDLKWLNEYPFNQIQYIVYNKGPNDNFTKKHVIKTVKLENIGRESNTFLYHIINNYNDLDDITIFLPGSVDMINKKYIAEEMITKILKYNKGIIVSQKIQSIFNKDIYNFKVDKYSSTNNKNKKINAESNLQLSKIRPFGKWYEEKFIKYDIKYISTFGIFSVDKRDILQFPKEYYNKFLMEVNESSNPEVGHYLEKSWIRIFNTKYTHISTNNFKLFLFFFFNNILIKINFYNIYFSIID